MASPTRGSSSRITAFLVITSAFTMLASYVAVTAHSLPGPLRSALVMWSPGCAALLVKIGFDRTFAGLGLGTAGRGWWLVGLLLPLGYALPVYVATWTSGFAAYDPAAWRSAVPYVGPTDGIAQAIALLLTVGLADKFWRALGEEIGWRGFLVPELLRHMSLPRAGVVSGLIWTAFHLPLILYGSYHANAAGGPPLGYQLACFTVMVTSLGVVLAFVRIRSESVWPCALLHASHNLLVQSVFDRATVGDPSVSFVTGEFGVGLAATCFVVALSIIALSSRRRMNAGGNRSAGRG